MHSIFSRSQNSGKVNSPSQQTKGVTPFQPAQEVPELSKTALPNLDELRRQRMEEFMVDWSDACQGYGIQGTELSYFQRGTIQDLDALIMNKRFKADWMTKPAPGAMGRIDQFKANRHKSCIEALDKAGIWPLAEIDGQVYFAVKVIEIDGGGDEKARPAVELLSMVITALEQINVPQEQAQLIFLQPNEFNHVISTCRRYQVSTEPLNKITCSDKEITEPQKACGIMLRRACESGASDIHIELMGQKEYRVRFRIDGILQPASKVHEELELLDKLPIDLARKMISSLKVKARMNVAEHRRPQDGDINFTPEMVKEMVDGSAESPDSPEFEATRDMLCSTSLRVSTCLAKTLGASEENMVLRVLRNSDLARISIERMGYMPDQVETINQVIKTPTGIILVTGPTGSGKSTTLYAILEKLNDVSRKIVTAEDPVERPVRGLTQVAMNENDGYNYTIALRQFLRHDPDVIFIGEMRDKESANLAVQAAVTGHLVLSTLHTNDAIGSLDRLIDTLGITPNLLAGTLRAVVAQRLVRRLCEACSEQYDAREELNKLFGAELLKEPVMLRRPSQMHTSCACCDRKGYKGRVAVAEIWVPDREEQTYVSKRGPEATAQNIYERSLKKGFKSMPMAGIEAALAGVTSLEELNDVAAFGQFQFEREYMARLITEKQAQSRAGDEAKVIH